MCEGGHCHIYTCKQQDPTLTSCEIKQLLSPPCTKMYKELVLLPTAKCPHTSVTLDE